MKTALITGITGQGGCYLARHLVGLGYRVIGTTRDLDSANLSGLEFLDLVDQVRLVPLDPTDPLRVLELVQKWHPDEIYHLAAPSSVAVSFRQPLETTAAIVTGNLNFLEAIRKVDRGIRFLEASSSEMFGNCPEPADESTPLNPFSPYGVAKAAAFHQTGLYRDAYHVHASAAIFCNFESPLRPQNFVTRKIAQGAADIARGHSGRLQLGNLDIVRDWGWAGEYMAAAHAMLQAETPEVYVIATGRPSRLRDFVALAFEHAGLDYRDYVELDESLSRPKDIVYSVGNPEKAARRLGWRANVTLEDIVARMMEEIPATGDPGHPATDRGAPGPIH